MLSESLSFTARLKAFPDAQAVLNIYAVSAFLSDLSLQNGKKRRQHVLEAEFLSSKTWRPVCVAGDRGTGAVHEAVRRASVCARGSPGHV